MIESDPVQTVSPTSSPLLPSLRLLLPINLKCTQILDSDWPPAPQSGLLLAPITADHSRSDFPARDLDFVSRPCPAWGGEAEGARRGEGHLHNLPGSQSLDFDGRGLIIWALE